ncbi:nuclear transport factor 2 family protein [Streptomyces sp. SID5914]|nr:nuclear transport factor 2 family protein [Streptomyces sp. SID5914]MZG13966.1 nuclear transport factor 2 family protein [Streptomyces sp. SID5914]
MPADEAEIERLLVTYATALDTKDWALLASCFTPDCQARYQDKVFDDREHLCRTMRKLHDPLDSSLHRISNVAASVMGDHATSVSYVDALLVHTGHTDGPLYRVAGRYEDELVRHRGQWLIRKRTFEPYWVWERTESLQPSSQSRAVLARVPVRD